MHLPLYVYLVAIVVISILRSKASFLPQLPRLKGEMIAASKDGILVPIVPRLYSPVESVCIL